MDVPFLLEILSMKISVKNIAFLVICTLICSCSGKKEDGALKEFKGNVTEVTNQILKVTDSSGKCVMFDNRKAIYVGGTIMLYDSVCVSYKGKLVNGTPSIVVEFISQHK